MAPVKHGDARVGQITPEYRAWQHMKNRCNNPRADQANYYGRRGIRVWPLWVYDFPAFLAYIGSKPTPRHTLDRIDNNLGYQPGNVRWATMKEQRRNRRDPGCLLSLAGKTQHILDWADELGISVRTLWSRKNGGWTDAEILTTAPRPLAPSASRVRRRRDAAGVPDPRAQTA